MSPAAPPPPQYPGGSQMFGKFTLVRELGRGGMGVVWLARDNDLGREVALKMLLSTETEAAELERFRREARAAARLKHPNIVPVYETGTERGRAYFAMEFVKGHSMDRRMPELPLRRRVEIVRDVARALHYAHGLGIVHRDMKPSNVMLSSEGRPMVMDFGLAKHLGDGRNLTQSGAIMGTPNFMSPEQAQGDPGAIDARTDVFSLGGVLYYFITDRLPFERADTVKTVFAVLSEAPVPPRKVKPAIPRDLEIICLKALAKLPAKRFQSAEEFADDLDRHLAGSRIEARPPGPAERGSMWVRRHPAFAAGILVAALGAVATISVWASGAKERRRRAQESEVAEERRKAEDAAAARRGKAAEWVLAGRAQLETAERCMMTGRAEDLRAALGRAVEAFDKALAADEGCGEALAGRGRSRRLRGERDGAIADLSRAGNLPEAVYELSLARLDLFIEARTFARSEPFDGGEPSAAARLARDRQLAAADDLARAALLPPPTGREWMPLHAQAALAFLAGKFPDARAGLDKVIDLNPFRDDALALRASVRLASEPPDAEGAKQDLERAVEANALSAAHRNLLGVVKGLLGDAKGARADFDAAVALDATYVPAVLNRSSSRLAAGDAAGAIADAARVLAASKDNLLALGARAEARLANGDWGGAEEDFSHALALSPGALPFRLRRATARRMAGNLDAALEDARAALQSGDVDVRIRASTEVAEILVARAEAPSWQEALAEVESRLALGSLKDQRPDEFLRLAGLFRDRGDKAKERAMLEGFLRHFPGNPRCAEVRAQLESLEK